MFFIFLSFPDNSCGSYLYVEYIGLEPITFRLPV